VTRPRQSRPRESLRARPPGGCGNGPASGGPLPYPPAPPAGHHRARRVRRPARLPLCPLSLPVKAVPRGCRCARCPCGSRPSRPVAAVPVVPAGQGCPARLPLCPLSLRVKAVPRGCRCARCPCGSRPSRPVAAAPAVPAWSRPGHGRPLGRRPSLVPPGSRPSTRPPPRRPRWSPPRLAELGHDAVAQSPPAAAPRRLTPRILPNGRVFHHPASHSPGRAAPGYRMAARRSARNPLPAAMSLGRTQPGHRVIAVWPTGADLASLWPTRLLRSCPCGRHGQVIPRSGPPHPPGRRWREADPAGLGGRCRPHVALGRL
jgi:hypothetical protein